MAGEINVADVQGRRFSLIFLFPITTPILDKDGEPIVTTPSNGLPAKVLAQLTTEVTALNLGTMIWKRTQYTANDGDDGPTILAKVQEMYAAQAAVAESDYADEHQFAMRIGQRFNAA